MKELTNKQPVLKDFPPILRKLATYMIENKDYETKYIDICLQADLNYKTVRQSLSRLNKKGISFDDYLFNERDRRLRKFGLHVDNSMVNGAISGSSKLIELYYKKQGEIIDRQQVDHNIQAKIVVFSPGNVIPDDVKEIRAKERDKDGVQIVDMSMDE